MAANNDVVVIGGGAAGIIAASHAAELGARVTLLEKNDKLGLKILISGGGKCNLTHDGTMEEIRKTFRANEGFFLKPSFYRFTNKDFLDILHTNGMQTYTRPDGRIFPVEPANARDVVEILTRYVHECGVRVRYGASVTQLLATDGAITGVQIGDEVIQASRVIVCTGGSSYPATGTTGDGWKWLADLGHTIVHLRAALAPIYLANVKSDWSGVALRDVVLRGRVAREGKEFTRWTGDLLFTHKGISGPTALGVSRDITERMECDKITPALEVDLAPTRTFEQIQADLRKQVQDNPRKAAASLAAPFVPSRLLDPLLASASLDPELRCAHLPAKSLNKLAATLKGWYIGDVRDVPLERGEVVAGGVALSEVDPQTMQSKLIKGLYLCGEVLDIAGAVGGYNLQAAWSTGYVAGETRS